MDHTRVERAHRRHLGELRGAHRLGTRGHRSRRGCRGRRRAQGIRRSAGVGELGACSSRGCTRSARRQARGQGGGDGSPGVGAERYADHHLVAARSGIPVDLVEVLRESVAWLRVRGRAGPSHGRQDLRAPRAGRRCRCDRSVELPSGTCRVQTRPRLGGGLCERSQAVSGDGPRRLLVRRSLGGD